MAYTRQTFPEWLLSLSKGSKYRGETPAPNQTPMITREEFSGLPPEMVEQAMRDEAARRENRYLERMDRSSMWLRVPSLQRRMGEAAQLQSIFPQEREAAGQNLQNTAVQAAKAQAARTTAAPASIVYATPESMEAASRASTADESVNPSKAAIDDIIQRKLAAAVQAGQPSEDINPNESEIDAALKIARQRALEAAYAREGQNGMLSSQNAWRTGDEEPGYTTPSAAGMWSGIDMRARPVTTPLDRQEDTQFSDIPGGAARLPTAAGSSTAPARPSTSAAAPAARPTPPMPLRSPVQREEPSVMSRIFGGGPEYQSTGQRLIRDDGKGVDFGSGENAADFFRASRALKEQRPEMFERQAEARGGAPKSAAGGGGKEAAMHKALEIIHHLLMRGR